MQDMQTGAVTCDGCSRPITEGGVVLLSPEVGLHPFKFAHDDSCVEHIQSTFRGDALTVKIEFKCDDWHNPRKMPFAERKRHFNEYNRLRNAIVMPSLVNLR